MNKRLAKSVSVYVLGILFLPIFTIAQTVTTNNNPGNPLPQGTANNLEATAQQIESSTAAAYQFKNEGIFGCNQVAGANASAGTLAAIGGVYVPVNDAAVTLNTGILVYKECVLRPLQDRLRESAMSALAKKNLVGITTGREGNKQFLVNLTKERQIWNDTSRLNTLTGKPAEGITPAFKNAVVPWSARTFQRESRNPESMLTCPYEDIALRIENQSDDSIGTIQAFTNPACIPHLNALQFEELADAIDAQAVADCMQQLEWGNGYYPVTDNTNDCLRQEVRTAAITVQQSFQTVFDSPIRQLESANDIGQMIGALFAGITTQALTDQGGLVGLTQSSGGQPSYLEQVARESSQGVIGAAVNAALTILNTSRQIEARYLAAMNSIASALTQAINQLRSTERACWDLIVPRAQSYAQCPSGSTDAETGAQTCGASFELDPRKISAATSSQAFSQQVIDSQVAPLAQAALTNVQNSQRALSLIDQLIAGVTNTASLNAQRLALQQLDNLVAQRQLHTRYDAENAEQQRESVVSAMGTLVTDTAKAWGDSSDASVGWCNINNQSVVRGWAERWRR